MIDTFVRAFRGTVRSPIRTLLVIILLAAGLSFALTSLALAFAADNELDKIKETTGVQAGVALNPDQFARAIQEEFTASQAEDRPFDSSRVGAAIEPLRQETADRIAALPYVRDVEVFTIAAVEYAFPDREAGRENDVNLGSLQISLPDAVITGTRDAAFIPDFQTGSKELRQGRLFTADDLGRNVIVIDQDTAAFEQLEVGDTIVLRATIPPEEEEETAPEAAAEEGGEASPGEEAEAPPAAAGEAEEGQEAAEGGAAQPAEGEEAAQPREVAEPTVLEAEAEIIGIYADIEAAAQGGFSPARIEAWYAPIDLVRQLQSEEAQDALSQIAIIYDSVDSVEQLKADLDAMLDPELYVYTTTEKRFEDIAGPVETMRDTSLLGMVIGLAVVGLIMVMLMALVVRGRLREIGILKAVGARNRHVILQFALETIGIAVVAVLVAVPISLASSNIIASAFRGDPTVEEQQEAQNQPLGPGARALTAAPVIDDPVRTEEVRAALEEVNASLSPQVIAGAAAIAVGLGLLGALVPIVAVLRLRPAEVLRLEG